jgi:hypothetical protein
LRAGEQTCTELLKVGPRPEGVLSYFLHRVMHGVAAATKVPPQPKLENNNDNKVCVLQQLIEKAA